MSTKSEIEEILEKEQISNLCKLLVINIIQVEKRTSTTSTFQDTYTAYQIETKSSSKEIPVPVQLVWRRYSDFEVLQHYFDAQYAFLIIPPIPEKRATSIWRHFSADKFDPNFIERRRHLLEIYLRRVSSHPAMSRDPMLIAFLRDDDFAEQIRETNYEKKADSWLKSLTMPFLHHSNQEFREMRQYADRAHTILSNLVKARSQLAERTLALFKAHAHYGREYCQWCGIEKELGEGLQKAGHYMDMLAVGIDAILEEEEQYADELKEYIFYMATIKRVCQRQQWLEHELERRTSSLAGKRKEKSMRDEGKSSFSLSSFKTRLFGESEQERAAKDAQLSADIASLEDAIAIQKEELNSFSQQATDEFDRFRQQKQHDLADLLINYSILQLKLAKKSCLLWTNIRDCFEPGPTGASHLSGANGQSQGGADQSAGKSEELSS